MYPAMLVQMGFFAGVHANCTITAVKGWPELLQPNLQAKGTISVAAQVKSSSGYYMTRHC